MFDISNKKIIYFTQPRFGNITALIHIHNQAEYLIRITLIFFP